ncbi:MAG: haloalkane dehalogenase [Chloroflexi bacterium]|nr:haloalkane dehalogenase [Chloroflexota bacterium]
MTPISSEFPFESQYVEVHGSRMHYVETGSGDPILFLHGNPTSSYLWRNVIPHVAPHGRCIAPDLIGMGQSDKPDLAYRFADHARYIEGFVEEMQLQNITLVLHDWGSGLGFYYAHRHPENIKALVFMEAIVRPFSWSQVPTQFRLAFRMMRTPGVGWFLVNVLNMFVNGMLPGAVVRKLDRATLQHYRAPFPTITSRKPVLQWPREVPFDGLPADTNQIISAYSQWLTETELPKLFFYATPGAVITQDTREWCLKHMPRVTAVDLGKGLHFVQEDHPDTIGTEIATWYAAL